MTQQERRTHPDPSATRDRRYVARLTNPNLRDSAEQIYLLVMGVGGSLVLLVVGLLVQGVMMSAEMLFRNVAIAIITGLITVLLFSYAKALKTYIKLETPTLLALCFERQRNIWMLLSFTLLAAIVTVLILSL